MVRYKNKENALDGMKKMYNEKMNQFNKEYPNCETIKTIGREEDILIHNNYSDEPWCHIVLLNDFKPLTDLEKMVEKYPYCYYCNDSLDFEESKTETHLSEMTESYGTLKGFRRYFEWDENLYLWFGSNRNVSLWC